MGNNKNFDVVVVGNAGIDTNVYFPGNQIDFKHEANFTENIDYVGQAGGYCARGFAQLGYNTAYIGYVGDDHNGELLLQAFEKDGINTEAVFIDPAGTSRSINFMYQDGRRKNFYDGKSHMKLEPDLDKCKAILKNSRLVHFNIPNWARYLLPIARDLNLKISTDLQDITDIKDNYRKDFIQYSDFIFFSNTNYSTPERVIKPILQLYPDKYLISGMGKKGCALGIKGGIQYFAALDMDQPVIDTNGAGDGLAVGFLSSYCLENESLTTAIKSGQIVARYSCTQKASTSSLIDREKLKDLRQDIVDRIEN